MPFLKAPKTFGVDFGQNNSHLIHENKEVSDVTVCHNLNISYLKEQEH